MDYFGKNWKNFQPVVIEEIMECGNLACFGQNFITAENVEGNYLDF